jgi:hypothetical protein
MPPVTGTDGAGSGITPTTTSGVWGDSATGVGTMGTSNSGDGVLGQSGKAVGVRGTGGRSALPTVAGVVGVWGDSKNGPGVFGGSDNAEGVRGESSTASGVTGRTAAANQAGVVGLHTAPTGFGLGAIGGTSSSDPGAVGVGGIAPDGTGVLGVSLKANGVRGVHEISSGLAPSPPAGVWGDARNGIGVFGSSRESHGVVGVTGGWDSQTREDRSPRDHAAVVGINQGTGGYRCAVYAHSDGGNGMWTEGRNGIIAWANPPMKYSAAVEGVVTGDDSICVYGYHDSKAKGGYAGYFWGRVEVTGPLVKTGGGFRIDHPADPGGKYLNHSFVESSERKNVYDGVALLNARGEAVVRLPAWVEAANRDFRYQLTAVGAPAPNLHVAKELAKGRFKIAGGRRRMRVCWQLTGVRKDAWADANPVEVEERKVGVERGTYLHPTLHGKPESKSVERARNPERARRIDWMRREAAASRRRTR